MSAHNAPTAQRLARGTRDWHYRCRMVAWLALAAIFFAAAVPGSPLRLAAVHATAKQPRRLVETASVDEVLVRADAPLDDATIHLGGVTYRATTKNIEDVTDQDIVLAKDPVTGELAAKPVVRTFRRTSDHLRVLRIRNAAGTEQTIETTNEHPFWVSGTGWVAAGKLAIGDTVTYSDGLPAELIRSNYEARPEGVPVYNFEVKDLHTYFVAATPRGPPVLVHNNCGSGAGRVILNLGGEGEVRGVINVQGSWVRNPNWRSARAGKTLAELRAEGHPFVIADNVRLPFRNGSVDMVLTNGVPIDVTTWLGPGVQSSEIMRILRPGGLWIDDGFFRFVR